MCNVHHGVYSIQGVHILPVVQALYSALFHYGYCPLCTYAAKSAGAEIVIVSFFYMATVFMSATYVFMPALCL